MLLSLTSRSFFLAFLLVATFSNAQVYEDYIGGGHSQGINVLSSDNFDPPFMPGVASAEQTINGSGLDARSFETARFLSQATLGADRETIEQVAQMEFEDWIDDQFNIQSESMLAATDSAYNVGYDIFVGNGGNPEDYFGPYFPHFNYGVWHYNMSNEDLLRQRVALALSEIFVISLRTQLGEYGDGLGDYYDVLLNNAFGNYEDLMLEVSMHPMMGAYLSHFNNPLEIAALNIHPDENYAREIMQLFSIGLYELNIDGSQVLDMNNDPIPTYDNNDIKEFAQVFTGLGPGDIIPNPFVNVPSFGLDFIIADKTVPMTMYDEWHDQSSKQLLNGFVIPAFQDGMDDIEMTIEHLFQHDNVGPFVALRLIQNLVKSNPTPDYIERVALKFNDNGAGVRGDMKAVIKAILLDEEARTCAWINESTHGKLREPMLRYFQFARANDKLAPSGLYWNSGYEFLLLTGQGPLAAPSVFNFFTPDYQPHGDIADAELVAPEFQIHNSRTSVGFMNMTYLWINFSLLWSFEEVEEVYIDQSTLEQMAYDPEVLLNHLDVVYTNGQLTEETRNLIKESMNQINANEFGAFYLDFRVKMALYLIMISPDYAILK
ncbi:MAG: DUF1800 family protein [Flavobacteriales bacterium]|nr:DUF1800 family protein [Flavobacteriales bacterium]